MRKFVLALVAGFFPSLAMADGGTVSQWVQFAPGGGAEARVLTTAAHCPMLFSMPRSLSMTERAAPDANFPVRLCSAPLPAGGGPYDVTDLPANGQGMLIEPSADARLPVIAATPKRIMVFGDTGCRIKGTAVQACNDPVAWPFAHIASMAAAMKPDLVIHVGDYLYRESPCPAGNSGCAGSPYGDNWDSWNADFFTPAAPLLHAAPWVIVRGNHEDCARGGPGFLRLLGPTAYDPAAPCTDHLAPYAVPVGPVSLVVMDNASAPDTSVDHNLVGAYLSDFTALPGLSKPPTWLVMHRPIWGAITGPMGVPVGGNATLIAALGNSPALDPAALMIAGHIHTFEAMNYASGAPGIVAGFGGDNLDVTPLDLTGANLQGKYVKDGLSLPGFGFLMMEQEPDGWRIDVHAVDGTIERVCHFAGGRVDCPAKTGG